MGRKNLLWKNIEALLYSTRILFNLKSCDCKYYQFGLIITFPKEQKPVNKSNHDKRSLGGQDIQQIRPKPAGATIIVLEGARHGNPRTENSDFRVC